MKINDVINSKYEVLSILSSTNKSTVGRCINKYLDNEWIIKYVPNHASILSDEVENMLRFNHKSIPKIIDWIKVPSGYYFIMTEVKGHTICEYTKIFKYTLSDVIKWMLELIGVIKHMHVYHVIHGDIKTSNIMLDDDQSLYIVDFGSSFTDVDKKSFTKKYVAPERLLDHFTVDDRSDLFSFGMVFKETLKSYQDQAPLLKFIESKKIRRINKIIKKCTEINPSYRYQSASELYEAIKDI